MRRIALTLISLIFIAGCSKGSAGGGVDSRTEVPTGGSILSALRPRVDSAAMAANPRAAQAQSEKAPLFASAAKDSVISQTNGLGRLLPKVSTDPIAPPAEEIATQSGPIVTAANEQPQITPNFASLGDAANAANAAQPTATYGSAYGAAVPPPPAGALGSALVPPPPAVTLSTQAQTAYAPGSPDPNNPYANPYAAPYAAPYANPYANPYLNPYGIPYPTQVMPQQAPPSNERPAGSPFASGGRGRGGDDSDDSDHPKKGAPFVPITPNGMEPRSAYKQRDDLKVLWKGLLANSEEAKAIVKDDKTADELNKIDVGLPSEATKGSFSVTQRLVDTIFKSASVDKRIVQPVRKMEMDLVQAYYRYLYSYNKFSLAQQTVAARKQEADVANTNSESQRAAADQAEAQTDAEAAKDDMRSAQAELAQLVGPAAARTIIGRVSGVTPTLDSLTQAIEQPSQSSKGGGKGPLSLFVHHKKEKTNGDETAQNAESGSDDSAKSETKVAKADKKDKKKVKGDKHGKDKDSDLSPAPDVVAAKGAASEAAEAKESGDISFQLKEVNVTPRKSILTVAIHNSGSNSFSFSPDVISISDGNHKLSDAAVRADFDQTLVQPNQEVKGTITIFGRPWNDRLAVVLSDGGKNIQMRR